MEIPEDLKQLYAKAVDRCSRLIDRPEEDFTVAGNIVFCLRELIERIASLEAALRGEQDKLRQMTDCRDDLNRLVAQLEAELAQARAENETYRMALHERNEENSALRAQLAEMSKPVSEEEEQRFALHSVDLVSPVRRVPAMLLPNVNALLAARAKKAEGKG